MASTVLEFKAQARREFTLPHSKLVVLVQMISCASFFGLGELPIPVTEDEAQANGHGGDSNRVWRAAEMNQAYADRAIVMAAVQPPFSDQPEDRNRDDICHVEDLSFADRAYLGAAILNMIGLNVQWAAQVQSFRSDAEREAGESAGGEVSPAAASGAAEHAGGVVSGSGPDLPA
jgi:hypothetical protein